MTKLSKGLKWLQVIMAPPSTCVRCSTPTGLCRMICFFICAIPKNAYAARNAALRCTAPQTPLFKYSISSGRSTRLSGSSSTSTSNLPVRSYSAIFSSTARRSAAHGISRCLIAGRVGRSADECGHFPSHLVQSRFSGRLFQ